MALTYGFYNSVNHDRRYYSTQFSNIVNAMITDGVFLTRGNAFAVTPAANGLGVNVDTGFAWFTNTWTENDQLLPLTLTAADVSRPRIDAIVLDVNGNDDTRVNDIIVVTGAPYSTPTKPTLINEGKHTQHALAYVTVNANATSILAENIEIVVGQNETPYADAKLSGIDITALFQQWQGEFETWFADVQSQLEGDVATNLLNKINALEQNKLDKVTDRATAEDLTTGAQDKWVSAGMLREESDEILTDKSVFVGKIALEKARAFRQKFYGSSVAFDRRISGDPEEDKITVEKSLNFVTNTRIATWSGFLIIKQNDVVLANISFSSINTRVSNDVINNAPWYHNSSMVLYRVEVSSKVSASKVYVYKMTVNIWHSQYMSGGSGQYSHDELWNIYIYIYTLFGIPYDIAFVAQDKWTTDSPYGGGGGLDSYQHADVGHRSMYSCGAKDGVVCYQMSSDNKTWYKMKTYITTISTSTFIYSGTIDANSFNHAGYEAFSNVSGKNQISVTPYYYSRENDETLKWINLYLLNTKLNTLPIYYKRQAYVYIIAQTKTGAILECKIDDVVNIITIDSSELNIIPITESLYNFDYVGNREKKMFFVNSTSIKSLDENWVIHDYPIEYIYNEAYIVLPKMSFLSFFSINNFVIQQGRFIGGNNTLIDIEKKRVAVGKIGDNEYKVTPFTVYTTREDAPLLKDSSDKYDTSIIDSLY